MRRVGPPSISGAHGGRRGGRQAPAGVVHPGQYELGDRRRRVRSSNERRSIEASRGGVMLDRCGECRAYPLARGAGHAQLVDDGSDGFAQARTRT